MQEEFHGEKYPEGPFKQLYGWGSINANVWLPSLSELVGTAGELHTTLGTYFSAMQGLNSSSNWHVDAQGGAQFQYFEQFNASGGGQKLWDACNQQVSWLRSSGCVHSTYTWQVTNAQRFDYTYATGSNAVHPVVDASSISLGLVFIAEMIESR